MKLKLEAPDNFRPDDVYAKLIEIGANRPDGDACQAMAALVLLLINHIADEEVVNEAIALVQRLPPAGRVPMEESQV